MKRAALFASVCLSLASSASFAADAPCTTASAACTEMVGVGASPGRTLVYRTYPLQAKNASITRALVVIHGLGRDADGYYRHALAGWFLAGALGDTLIIAPRFASNAGKSCKD